ncbi:MAG: DNA-directed RNA polymerase subunit omega [Clostridia bacterium]|nr:DNA-directed RNA polymerase subunit omega [Clostridia bacterium]MBR2349811.1 DNA-directed RNA polymerase subunit omega [Clostridia bacterium]
MIEPPIDKLIKKAPCRYALVLGITKRAKDLQDMETSELEQSGMKAVSYAATEIYEDKIKIIVNK